MEDLMNGNAGWNKVPSQIQTILDNLSTSIQESYKLKGADATELDQFKALCDSYKAKFDSTTGTSLWNPFTSTHCTSRRAKSLHPCSKADHYLAFFQHMLSVWFLLLFNDARF